MFLLWQIFNKFGVMPSDQHLFVDGIDLDQMKESFGLSDTEATLLNLQVKPNASVKLVVSDYLYVKIILGTERLP